MVASKGEVVFGVCRCIGSRSEIMIRILRDKMVPRELRNLVDQELEPGERVQWMESPIPRMFTVASIVPFLFSIPWTAFALFWIYGASGFKVPDFSEGIDPFPLFGVPFVLIGIGMFLSPVFSYRSAKKTVYAITEKRGIMIKSGFSKTIRSFRPDELGEIYRREKKDGTGDVILGKEEKYNTKGRPYIHEFGFMSVEKPKEVEAMMRALHERAGKS